METVLAKIQQIVWGPVTLFLMTGIGVYYLFQLRFFPILKPKWILRVTIGGLFRKKRQKQGEISPFAATATALAGTLGTGNIVGIATALTTGGAGAVFWMWISAFLGMATKYAEIVLAVHFREKGEQGSYFGGPMYYMEKGLKQKWLGVLFALLCALAAFGIGNATQVNAISQSLQNTFRVDPLVTGIVCVLLAAFVMMGGFKRITKITTTLIPFLAIGYLFFTFWAILSHWERIPAAFESIFRGAFSKDSVRGGVLGITVSKGMRYGFSRGIFSHEAGLGSAPIAHAGADTPSASEQGMWGIFEVFFDTIVMCTATALVILTSGVLKSGADGAALTTMAFAESFGWFSEIFLTISISLFAFATLIGWSYYGEQSVMYLTKSNTVKQGYRFCYLLVILIGAMMELTTVWNISDILNGLMALPNLIALIGLSKTVRTETEKINFDSSRKSLCNFLILGQHCSKKRSCFTYKKENQRK